MTGMEIDVPFKNIYNFPVNLRKKLFRNIVIREM